MSENLEFIIDTNGKVYPLSYASWFTKGHNGPAVNVDCDPNTGRVKAIELLPYQGSLKVGEVTTFLPYPPIPPYFDRQRFHQQWGKPFQYYTEEEMEKFGQAKIPTPTKDTTECVRIAEVTLLCEILTKLGKDGRSAFMVGLQKEELIGEIVSFCSTEASEAVKHALCDVLDRIGADGPAFYFSEMSPQQLQDEIYDMINYLEVRARQSAFVDLLKKLGVSDGTIGKCSDEEPGKRPEDMFMDTFFKDLTVTRQDVRQSVYKEVLRGYGWTDTYIDSMSEKQISDCFYSIIGALKSLALAGKDKLAKEESKDENHN